MASPRNDFPASEASEVLRRVFGYEEFREGQQEIIEHVVAGGGRKGVPSAIIAGRQLFFAAISYQ